MWSVYVVLKCKSDASVVFPEMAETTIKAESLGALVEFVRTLQSSVYRIVAYQRFQLDGAHIDIQHFPLSLCKPIG